MKLRLQKIHDTAQDRPPGYAEDVISRGVIEGEWLHIPDEAMAELRSKYRPALPSISTMVASAARAVMAETVAIIHSDPPVPVEEIATRMEICRACEFFFPDQDRCSKCGCYSAMKSRLRSQHCPIAKW
jgi:hypothetical protein